MIGMGAKVDFLQPAWPVNFSLPLRAFEPSLRGLKNLLQLSHSPSRGLRFIFCSSTAAILGPNHSSVIPETISTSPNESDSLGYSRSKWVAESICSRVVELNKELKVKIVRIGQLTGDTEHGVWNMSEAYPLMLSTVNDIGGLPRINDKLSWLPLDVAAKAFCEICLMGNEKFLARESGVCEVYHVVNNDTSVSFTDLLEWLKEIRKEPFEVIEPREWIERLEKLEHHPAKALLGLWKRVYGDDDAREDPQQIITFITKNAARESKTMRSVSPVDKILFAKIWMWLEGELGNCD
jgi:thioester reductase-like protein